MEATGLLITTLPCLPLGLLVGINLEVAVVGSGMVGGYWTRGGSVDVLGMVISMVLILVVDFGCQVLARVVVVVHVGEHVQFLP